MDMPMHSAMDRIEDTALAHRRSPPAEKRPGLDDVTTTTNHVYARCAPEPTRNSYEEHALEDIASGAIRIVACEQR